MGFLSDLIGGKHKTIPTSSSESESTQRSRSGSVSSGSSSSFGSSSSLSRALSEVFGAEAYSDLFGGARAATERAQARVPGLTGTAGRLFSSGAGFLEELSGETATERRLLDTGVEDDLISQLGSDLGRFFGEEINPAIASRGVATGTLGGSRGEVARGTAARGLASEFVRGSTEIRRAGVERRDRLASEVDSTRGSRIGQSLSALPGLFGLAEAGIGAEFMPLMQLASILGDRTVLTESGSTSSSETGSFASQLARAFSATDAESKSRSSGSQVVRGPGLLDIANTAAQFFSPGAG